jgi:hypothetical protein
MFSITAREIAVFSGAATSWGWRQAREMVVFSGSATI